MHLGIIVVSYNTRRLLGDCLRALQKGCQYLEQAGRTAEIYVVDNASPDGSAAYVQAEFPAVHLTASSQNLGFAAANNLVLRQWHWDRLQAAGPDVVVLVNPDTEVHPAALNLMLEFLLTHPRVGVAAAQLRYGDDRFQHGAFCFPDAWQVYFDLFPNPLPPLPILGAGRGRRVLQSRLNGRYARELYRAGMPFQVDHPLGACLMVRRQAVLETGLLDNAFWIYGEEIDWCWRMQRAGWPAYCVPRALVVHHEGQSTRQFKSPMFVQLWQSRLQLFRKHRPGVSLVIIRSILYLGLAAAERRARRMWQTGEILDQEYQARLDAYRQVRKIWGA
ncbi:MAG: glycosyltransferase family 2 protein [Chloroflexi bacterium]|nr:glycosyltransferase family 2 protein [Chloroflexota bacterium]